MSDILNDFSADIYRWTYSNFRLQVFLIQHSTMNEMIAMALNTIGYEEVSFYILKERQKRDLVQENGFFGSIQTGNRIVSFALKKSGLHKDRFDAVQKSIDSAYKAILVEFGDNQLIQESYLQTIQALSVFRP